MILESSIRLFSSPLSRQNHSSLHLLRLGDFDATEETNGLRNVLGFICANNTSLISPCLCMYTTKRPTKLVRLPFLSLIYIVLKENFNLF